MKTITRIAVFAVFYFVVAVLLLSAQTYPSIQGRYEFVILTGDSPAQLNQIQGSISTYLIQSGNVISNLPAMTTDTFAQDEYSYNNGVFSGTVTKQGNVSLTYTVTNPDGTIFHYVFTGSQKEADGDNPTRLAGSYTSDSWSSTGSGTFAATYVPDFVNTTYQGQLDGPNDGSGPVNVAMSMTLNTLPNHTLNVTNVNLGAPLNACFIPPFHVTNAPAPFQLYPTAATGVAVQIYLQDSVGNQLYLNGYDVQKDGFTPAATGEYYQIGTPLPNPTSNLGTNNMIAFYYGITSNNACNNMGGGDSPFQPVPVKGANNQGHRHGR